MRYIYLLSLFTLMIISTTLHAQDNVGIGTASPSEKLDITGNTKAQSFIDRDDASYYLDPANSGTAGLFKGKVGIGTTSPAVKLDVSGNIKLSGGNLLDAQGREIVEGTGSTSDWLRINQGPDNKIALYGYGAFGSGGLYVGDWSDAGDGNIHATNNIYADNKLIAPVLEDKDNTSYQVDPSGDSYLSGSLGLGTTSPGVKLDVKGNARADRFDGVYTPRYQNWKNHGTGDGSAAIYNDNGSYQKLMIVGNNSSGGPRKVKIWDDLYVDDKLRMEGDRIIDLASPNNASDAATKSYVDNQDSDDQTLAEVMNQGNQASKNLDMNGNDIDFNSAGNISSAENINVSTVNSNNGNNPINFHQGFTVDGDDGGAGNVMVEEGKVGIGTSSANDRLEVNGDIRIDENSSTNPSIRIGNNDLSPERVIHVQSDGDVYMGNIDGGGTSSNLHIRAGGSTRIFAESGGQVGFGTTSPSNQVDINVGSSNNSGISLDGNVAVSTSGNWLRLNNNGDFSSGIYTPGKLRVESAFRFTGGSPSQNKVLTATDGNGNTTWKDIGNAGIGDNLGNHSATQNLDMNNDDIRDINNIRGGNGNLDIYSTSNYRILLRAKGSSGELGWYDDYNNRWVYRYNNGSNLNINPIGNIDINGNNINNANVINFNSGEKIEDGNDLKLHSNSGYIGLRPDDGTHGLIMRDFDGSSTSWSGIRTQDNGRMELGTDDASYSQLQLRDNGDVTMNDGNVGIGTSSASHKLYIDATSSDDAVFIDVDEAAGEDLVIDDDQYDVSIRPDASGEAWLGTNSFPMQEVNANTKNFVIRHPQKEGWKLKHSVLEGPENGVYYRGKAQLQNGKTTVQLPDYFEALTKEKGRTVQLTPIAESGKPISNVAATKVENGQFTVRAITKSNPQQKFYWKVTAKRADVPPVKVEIQNPAEYDKKHELKYERWTENFFQKQYNNSNEQTK